MAQITRIPAWKRLGLKLQKFDQSQEECAPPEEARQLEDSSVERGVPLKNADHSSHAPIETQTPRLGKRKHRDHAAELVDGTSKKSKIAQRQEPDYGFADTLPSTSDARPIGDPNYRKKKEKGQKRQWVGQSATQATSSVQKAAEKIPESSLKVNSDRTSLRTPSLSPGRLDPGAILLASTETDFPPSPPKRGEPSSSPPAPVDRRKSVTFTPDTKTVDGNSASNLFKKWVQEQKTAAEFTEAEVAQFEPPPKVHPANGTSAPSPAISKEAKKEKKEKKAKKAADIEQDNLIETDQKPQIAAATATKKKDPTRYLDYLTQYYNDRPNWKFNKAKQNDVLNNAINIFRIPESHSDALIAYVEGLQGAGVIQRLNQQCIAAIEEIDTLGTDPQDDTMDDPKVRQAAQDEALKELLAKQRKRRRLDRDTQNFAEHEHPDGFIRRLKKGRAQALLKALGQAAPAPAPATKRVAPYLNPDRKAPKAKKTRSAVEESSDESTDSSSSEESSSEESSSEEEDSDESLGTGSGLGSDGKSSSVKSASSSGESDSDSD